MSFCLSNFYENYVGFFLPFIPSFSSASSSGSILFRRDGGIGAGRAGLGSQGSSTYKKAKKGHGDSIIFVLDPNGNMLAGLPTKVRAWDGTAGGRLSNNGKRGEDCGFSSECREGTSELEHFYTCLANGKTMIMGMMIDSRNLHNI